MYHLKLRKKDWDHGVYIPMICDTQELEYMLKKYSLLDFSIEYYDKKCLKEGTYYIVPPVKKGQRNG